jgi:NADH-ubiquinone oxidoreductase chain 2
LLISSLLSLIIGTVVGLVQSRIKRLLAYSTISHVGFILLALNINSAESIQAFIFYLMQYSLSNLNIFFIIISLGYLLIYYNSSEEYNLVEKDNSPIQLISQFSGFFFKNQILCLCLAITLFSFAGIPPLLGFFAKQLILSAALDKGYVFMALVAIITSVIGAVYYLKIIKVVFFDEDKYIVKPEFMNILNTDDEESLENKSLESDNTATEITSDIKLSTSLSLTISSLTIVILLFINKPTIFLTHANILALIILNP